MTISEKPLCKSIAKKTYTKTCYRLGCGNVFTTTAFNAMYCGEEECKRLVYNANSQKYRERKGTKKRAPTKGVKIRREAKSVEGVQKWLSMPLRK